MTKEKEVYGYLPDEDPSLARLLLYALQQVIVMFPATITVALITGFQVSTTIFASGLATLCFILITKRRIPLYYGSSFAYLSAVSSMAMAEGTADQIALWQQTGILPPELISKAQLGIIKAPVITEKSQSDKEAGKYVFKVNPKATKLEIKDAVEKLLPASITGSVSMIIGLTLSHNALGDFINVSSNALQNNLWLLVAIVTLLSTVIYSRYLKGLLGQLPLLLGVITGCVVAALFLLIFDVNLFRSVPQAALEASIFKLGDGSIFALPAFTLPKFSWAALIGIMPIAIATLPESTAHIYQLDIYVNDVAKQKGKAKYDIESLLPDNLIGDGLCDMISGLVGGPAGTNYGENISTMAITKVFSVKVLSVAAIIAMIISCFTPLIKVIYGIPTAVIGGIEVYCFGAIAAQGIAIMVDKKVSMFDSKNIAVNAIVMMVGLGGQYAFNGTIPLFGINVPNIAAAAIIGIAVNALLSIGEKKKD